MTIESRIHKLEKEITEEQAKYFEHIINEYNKI